MPSSRASSPLSSATPSPPASPTRSLRASWLEAGVSPSSRRQDRSPTSSTAPFSQDGSPPRDQDEDNDDESDLTEEDDDDEEVRPAVPMMREAREESLDEEEVGEMDEPAGGEDEDEAEVDEDDEAVGPKPRSHERRLVKSRTTSKSASRSPSLTPPPPSVLLKARELTGSPKREDRLSAVDDDDEVEEDDDVEMGGENGTPTAQQGLENIAGLSKGKNGATGSDHDDANADEEDDEDDGGEDGDVTMRPAEDEDVEDADPVDEADGDEDEKGQMNGLPSVFVEDAEADGDADPDADADEEQGETGAAEEDEEEHEAQDVPKVQVPTKSHPSHAPPPTSAHMRALLILELKFAALRDKLYIERMEEAAAEEQMVLDGTHPALQHLHKTLAERRERLHEVASRRHQEAVSELKRAREADKEHTWSWWTEQRDSLHWEEFDRTWSKRRRLAREKNELETPRIVKPLPQVGHRPKGVDWSTGVGPAKMSMDDASADLAMMDPRAAPTRAPRLSRHASPATFGHHGVAAVNQPVVNAPSAAPAPAASLAQRPAPAVASSQPPPTFPYNSAHPYQPAPRQTAAQHAAYRPSQPAHQQPAQTRPLGRTVPTTSDLFDSGRKDPSPANMAWNKPDARASNGHAHTPLTPASATIPGTNAKADERATRFPGLSEYLNSSKQAMASMPGLPHSHAQTQSALGLGLAGGAASHNQAAGGNSGGAQNGSTAAGPGANSNVNGNGTSAAALANGGGPAPVSAAPPAAGTTAPSYASMLSAGGKMLSPPKAGTTSLLGTFGVRPAGPFGQTPGAPAASATTAGTNAGRS